MKIPVVTLVTKLLVNIVDENVFLFSDPDSDKSAQFLPINASIPIKKENILSKDVNAPLQPCGELGTPEPIWKFPIHEVMSDVTVEGIYKSSLNICFGPILVGGGGNL